MEDPGPTTDLVIALAAALLGGAVAHRLGQPVLVGWIVAGILIGPNTPGLVANRHSVELLANLGVAPLPLLSGSQENLLLLIAKSLGMALLALVIVNVLGTRLVPKLLYQVARPGSRELFLVAIVNLVALVLLATS